MIWTRVTVSSSYDDNHYTTGTSILTHICIYQFLRTSNMRHKVYSKVEFNTFEFRVYLFLDQFPNQELRPLSVLIFAHSWRGNSWIHTFPKVISPRLNGNSLVQAWTRFAAFVSYDDNYDFTNIPYIYIYIYHIYIYICVCACVCVWCLQ